MGMEYCPLPVEDTLNLPGMLPTELAMACDTKPMAVAMRKKSARRLIIPSIPSSYLFRPNDVPRISWIQSSNRHGTGNELNQN
jgi:hypothetical protein